MKLQEIVDKGDFINNVERELNKLKQENPDFVYQPPLSPTGKQGYCSYKDCIFGQALQKLGWSDEEEIGVIMDIHELIRTFTNFMYDEESGYTCPTSWCEMQHKQDLGTPWGRL